MANFIPGSGKGEVVALEIGSIYVIEELRGHGVGKILINELLKKLDQMEGFDEIPVFAVVTWDNEPSNRLFGKDPRFNRQELTSTETDNFNFFAVGGVNIFYGWGKPSNIYWLKR